MLFGSVLRMCSGYTWRVQIGFIDNSIILIWEGVGRPSQWDNRLLEIVQKWGEGRMK